MTNSDGHFKQINNLQRLVSNSGIQRHSVSIDHGAPIQGVSNIHQRQTDILAALSIKKPAHDAQMTLL